ncbi:MAG: HAD-IIIA family hydrolase [Clostridiaceae bacterium]|nr:HAD-IIIA family hydrolase [Clostridiaceae bacterium]
MSFKCMKYLVLDVDGTLTDGGIYYDEHGNEMKKFCTRDAAGIFAIQKAGVRVVVLTGRESKATEKRMTELSVDFLFQNIKDKYHFLQDFMQTYEVSKSELGYIGDDLNDLKPMQLAGFVGCPKDACKEVLAIADCISQKNGGCGAVRDVIEQMMNGLGTWEETVNKVYGMGI